MSSRLKPNFSVKKYRQDEENRANPPKDQKPPLNVESFPVADQVEKFYEQLDKVANLPGDIVLDAEGKLFKSYLANSRPSGHLIDAFDDWLTNTLPKQIYRRMPILNSGKLVIDDLSYILSDKTPQRCRDENSYYILQLAARIFFVPNDPSREKTEIKGGKNQSKSSKMINIGKIPLMLGSRYSHFAKWGKNQELWLSNGEDPADPGGYFIAKGAEKLVIIQEKVQISKILVWYADKKTKVKGRTPLTCRMTCPAPVGTIVVLLQEGKIGNLRLTLPFLGKTGDKDHSVNVLTLLRLLGKEIDRITGVKVVKQQFGSYDKIINTILNFTSDDAKARNVVFLKLHSSLLKAKLIADDAGGYHYFIRKIQGKPKTAAQKAIAERQSEKTFNQKLRVITGLLNELFPQIVSRPDLEGQDRFTTVDLIQKYNMLSMMICKMLEVMAGLRDVDDRDSWSNKKLVTAAGAMEQLFNSSWLLFVSKVEAQYSNLNNHQIASRIEDFANEAITKTFESSFHSPKWGIKNSYAKQNVTDILSRISIPATLEHMRRINTPTSRKAKQNTIRAVQMSQFAFISGENTPEGANCLSLDTDVLVDFSGKTVKIKDLKDGDTVVTIDPETKNRSLTKIINFFVKSSNNYGKKMLKITTKSGRTIKATEDHLFLTNKGFVEAGKLDVDQSTLIYGTNINNDDIMKVESIEDQLVADFTTVADTHTFVANNFVVHNCGLLKHLAATTKISIERPEKPLLVKVKNLFQYNKNQNRNAKFIINGKFAGWCNGEEMRRTLVNIRRELYNNYPDISVVLDIDNTLYLYTNAGRPVRPLLIYGDGQSPLLSSQETTIEVQGAYNQKIKQRVLVGQKRYDENNKLITTEPGKLVIDQLNAWSYNFGDLLRLQCVEYLDPFEQEFIKLATQKEDEQFRLVTMTSYQRDLEQALSNLEKAKAEGEITIIGKKLVYPDKKNKLKKHEEQDVETKLNVEQAEREVEKYYKLIKKLVDAKPYTHCEIDPTSILSLTGGIIPFVSHNPSARVSFQANMLKQAVGISHANFNLRWDTGLKILPNTQRPLAEPQTNAMIGMDTQPTGQNILIGFIPYRGWNQEDSFVVKKSSIELGMFTYSKYTPIREEIKSGEERKQPISSIETERDKFVYANIDSITGLPKIGSIMEVDQCVIGKITKTIKNEKTEISNTSRYIKQGEEGVVERVFISRSENRVDAIKVLIRKTRQPVVGDKFAPRMSQKGTIGRIEDDINMPVIMSGPYRGASPDLLVSPASIPSRMTASMLIELSVSKVAAATGQRYNASGFRKVDKTDLKRLLLANGFSSSGKEMMMDGVTGKMMEGAVNVGPMYYQMLKHHVKDKIQARDRGGVSAMTRQPIGGRARGGALRVGEMERDSFISHGASAILRDRLCDVSDAYEIIYCTRCGMIAVSDIIAATTECRKCKKTDAFQKAVIPYVYKWLMQLLWGAGISMTIHGSVIDKKDKKDEKDKK